MSKQPARILVLIVLAIFAGVVLMQMFMGSPSMGLGGRPKEMALSEFNTELAAKNVADVKWQESTLNVTMNNGDKRFVQGTQKDSPTGEKLTEKILASGAKLSYEPPPLINGVMGFLGLIIGPLLVLLLLYFLFIKPAQMGGNQAMNFGRSRAKRVGETGPKVTFEDVAGIEEAKQELAEIVDFLRNTKKYSNLGAKIPKGILLTGPPGVGKTYLARAIAGEAGVPFFHISGSDFVEMFVGVGAARVRDLFETAKAHRPSLIFVDEIDAVGRQRGAGLGGGHDEREQTLNQLLVEMDGFDPNSGVILIAATNRPDVLDPALLRPGRFDRQIVVDAPDQAGRLQILKVHAKNKPLDPAVDLEVLARRTPGFTGADLANMLNEGALLAARRNQTKISQVDLEEALDRTIAGPQRRSRVMDQQEREVIAYHEAGHAVVGELLDHADPVHKVTILPRGMSLGSTWQLPVADKYLVSREELQDDITALLGGRVAEEIVYGRVWTGASNDLARVTRIARAMVCEYGMSERLGTLAIGRRNNNPFLGRDFHEDRNYSEEIAKQVDEEVRIIVDRCHQRCHEILTQHRTQLDAVVKALMERETLDREEFLKVMDGQELPPLEKNVPPPGPPAEPARESSDSGHLAPIPPRLEPGPA